MKLGGHRPMSCCEAEGGVCFCVGRANGCAGGSVWGTGVYTDDSSRCAAALHAGVVTDDGGWFRVVHRDGLPSYRGSTSHYITSGDYGAWTGSFEVTFADDEQKEEPVELPQPTQQSASSKAPRVVLQHGPCVVCSLAPQHVLPCGHSLCLSCVEAVETAAELRGDRQLRCPLPSCATVFSKEGLSTAGPANGDEGGRLLCQVGFCGQPGARAELCCAECKGVLYCTACFLEQHRSQRFQIHAPVKLPDDGQSCPSHVTQVATAHCDECGLLVCPSCTNQHEGHSVIGLGELNAAVDTQMAEVAVLRSRELDLEEEICQQVELVDQKLNSLPVTLQAGIASVTNALANRLGDAAREAHGTAEVVTSRLRVQAANLRRLQASQGGVFGLLQEFRRTPKTISDTRRALMCLEHAARSVPQRPSVTVSDLGVMDSTSGVLSAISSFGAVSVAGFETVKPASGSCKWPVGAVAELHVVGGACFVAGQPKTIEVCCPSLKLEPGSSVLPIPPLDVRQEDFGRIATTVQLDYTAHVAYELHEASGADNIVSLPRELTKVEFSRAGASCGDDDWVLSQSSRYSGMQNTKDALLDESPNTGCGTNYESPSWIAATFSSPVCVSAVKVGAYVPGGWGPHYTENLEIQSSLDGTTWQTVGRVSGVSANAPKLFHITMTTARHWRLFNRVGGWMAIGTLKFVVRQPQSGDARKALFAVLSREKTDTPVIPLPRLGNSPFVVEATSVRYSFVLSPSNGNPISVNWTGEPGFPVVLLPISRVSSAKGRKWLLTMPTPYPGLSNSYEALQQHNTADGAACSGPECWIDCTFAEPVVVSHISVAPLDNAAGGWSYAYTENASLEYSFDQTKWETALVVTGIQHERTFDLPAPICAQYWRLGKSQYGYIASSLLIFA